MTWFDSGHTDPTPRGEMVDIPKASDYFQAMHGARPSQVKPIGKITTHPHGKR